MKYKSTRGGSENISFGQVVQDGYAADSGLYVPHEYPKFDLDELRGLKTYPKLAFAIWRQFISAEEISNADLKTIASESYKSFPENAVPTVELEKNLFAAELFHGPTLCFKDLGQQVLVRFLAHFLKSPKCLVASTTGDTGPAALNAVKSLNSDNLRLVVAHPYGQISEFQRRQMTTIPKVNHKTVTFHGGGDDLDGPIKNIATDKKFQQLHPTCGINSYNFGRVLAQSVHYFWSYFQVTKSNIPVEFILPIGAMGNIAAGNLSRMCGLPISRFVGGVNINDIVHRGIAHGKYYRELEMKMCLSEAINIQAPYNFERILYWVLGCDTDKLRALMTSFEKDGKLDIPKDVLEKLQQLVLTFSVPDAQMLDTIRRYQKDYNYLVCPHGAVACYAADNSQNKAITRIILCTAHWSKFQKAITTAFDEAFVSKLTFPDSVTELMNRPELSYDGEFKAGTDWEAQLRTLISNF